MTPHTQTHHSSVQEYFIFMEMLVSSSGISLLEGVGFMESRVLKLLLQNRKKSGHMYFFFLF